MIREKREKYRVELNVPVESAALNKTVQNAITNISTNGAFISTKNPLPIDKELEIKFTLPGTTNPMKLKAKVVWARDAGDKAGMGISFLDVAEKDFDSLLEFMSNLYK